jgi:hypothetical protein
MVFAWREYKCPHCKETLSDSDIATIHFTKQCQYCNGILTLNSHEALENGIVAGFIAVLILGSFVIVSFIFYDDLRQGLITIGNISEYLGIAVFVGYLILGVYIATTITSIYAKIMILIAKKDFE